MSPLVCTCDHGQCAPCTNGQRPLDVDRIGRSRVSEVRLAGRSIGMVNDGDAPHAIDSRSVVHYAATVDACIAWLVGRAS